MRVGVGAGTGVGFASCSSRLCFPRCAPKSEGVLGLDEVRDASALLECRLAQRQRALVRVRVRVRVRLGLGLGLDPEP